MNNIHYTRNQESVDKHKKILYEIIFKTQSDVFYLQILKFTVWIHMSKEIWSSQSKNKHLISQVYADHLIDYINQSDTIFKVFKLRKQKNSINSLLTVKNADIDEEINWKLYNNLNLSMFNLNFIFSIQKTVTSISAISIFFAQKMQKCEIHFRIKYFDKEFNLSKSD